MICVYDETNENYAGNGNAVLTPLECRHTQAAAGKYDLTIVCPIDKEGKWTHLVEEAVIKAPVPEETIETAVSGIEADLYRTNTEAALREYALEPYRITYQEWNGSQVSPTTYQVGDKVTVSTASHRNYECIYFDADSQTRFVPPYNSSWWTPIADWADGAPVIVNLKSGTDLYYLEAASTTGWAKVSTMYGLEGYIKTSQITYIRHLTPSETQPRTITEQLFRIRSVSIETKDRTVTATAEHVSYDLSGVLMDSTKIVRRSAAYALAMMEQAYMIPYRGMIATNMTSENDGLYSGEINGKNAINALLDPDKGIVAALGAMYRRDNWDLFVMKMVEKDRGFQLRYRKNMLGVNWDRKSIGLITRVVPVAKDEDGNELFLDLNGARWVDSPMINNHRVIRMERIRVNGQVGKDDGTETATNWTTATLRAEMQRQAQNRFDIDNVDKVIHEITVDFEMQGDTEEYKALKALEHVLLYDTVTCINEEIGLSIQAQVTEIEYNCIRKKVAGVKLSNVRAYRVRNVYGFNVFDNSITGAKLTDDAGDRIADTAADMAAVYTDQVGWNIYYWALANFEPKS